MRFEEMWHDLAPIGRSAASGGYNRSPWASAEIEMRQWFLEQASSRDLSVEQDVVGNMVAWWGQPSSGDPGDTRPSGIMTGSHLDSVLDGGAYDGPLGVVSALAAIDLLRECGFEPARPIGVSVFVEEEGSRFGLACLGSRLATGVMSWEQARELRDRDGMFLPDAIEGSGLHLAPDEEPGAWAGLHDRVGTFVELHVEQGRDLVHRDVAVGVASGIWPHGRWRFDFAGEANHAGSTRMEDRRDPMLTYAMSVLAANKQARLAGQRATFGRITVEPNGTNAVPSLVTAWLDARASSDDALAEMVARIEQQADDRAARDGTSLAVTDESVSRSVTFDPALAERLATLGDWPTIATQAGHDAGILSDAGIPTAMLFVRNPTGVSHSPAETADMDDCLAGVVALADVLAELARSGAPA